MLAGGKRFQHETQSCPDDPLLRTLGLGSWKPGSLLWLAQRKDLTTISFVLLRERPEAEAMSEDGHSPYAQHRHK